MRVTTPHAIRARILQYAAQPKPDEYNHKLNGSIIGEIEKIIKVVHKGQETEYRRIMFGWLFGAENLLPSELSSKVLTPQMWYGLQKWIGAKAVELGNGKVKWTHRPEFEEELWWVVSHAKCVFDSSARLKPPATLGEVENWMQSEWSKKNTRDWLEYDANGMVSAGIQKGCAVVTPIPYEEPAPPKEPEPEQTVQLMPVVAETYSSSVSNVNESEL